MTDRPDQGAPFYRRLPVLIACLVAAIAVLGSLGLQRMKTILMARTGESLAVAAAGVADRLDQVVFERYGDIHMMARALQARDAVAMSEYVAWVKNTYPYYAWIAVADANGRIVAATNSESVGQDHSRSAWFQAVREQPRAVVQDVPASGETEGRLAIGFTSPVADGHGVFKGAVTARVPLRVIEEGLHGMVHTFEKHHVGRGQFEYMVMTADGELIIDSSLREEARVNLKEKGVPSALRVMASEEPGYVEEESPRLRMTMLTGYARTKGIDGFPNSNWGVLIRMSGEEVVSPIHELMTKIGLAAVALVAPLVGLLFWTSGRLRKEWGRTRQREAWLSTTLNSIGDAVIATDMKGSVTFMNRVAERLTGWTHAEAAGRPLHRVFAIVNEQTRLPVSNPLGKMLETGVIVGLSDQTVLMAKDGAERPIDDSGSPIRNEDGEIIGVVLIFRDVTERKEAEQRLRESERLLAKAQQLAHLGSWEWDLAADRVTWSDELCLIFGAKPEEFGGTYARYLAYVHPDDRAMVEAKIAKAIQDHEPFALSHRIRRPDGGERILHAIGEVIVDEGGRVGRMIGAAQDVTELKEAEAALHASQNELERRVRDRTSELATANAALQEKVEELEKFEEAVVGRELKMIELEKEIDKLRRDRKSEE
ncbi:MAG: PAS domain S-box protein [Nitrospiraceae bacterium]